MGFTEYCKKFILIGVGEGCKFTMNFYWSQTILTISGTAIKRAFTESELVIECESYTTSCNNK